MLCQVCWDECEAESFDGAIYSTCCGGDVAAGHVVYRSKTTTHRARKALEPWHPEAEPIEPGDTYEHQMRTIEWVDPRTGQVRRRTVVIRKRKG